MPTPYEFASEEELVHRLNDPQTVRAAESFFSQRCSSISEVVSMAVVGNTFRGFRNLPERPSVAFRSWATKYIVNTFHTLSVISDGQCYDQYVHDANQALCHEWLSTMGTEMGYGRGAKLLNLVLKKFACLSSLAEQKRSALIPLLHTPFDSYTLVGLRKAIPRLLIPKSATMKYIESPTVYAEFQAAVREMAKKAGVPPIYYDVLAWDMSHKKLD